MTLRFSRLPALLLVLGLLAFAGRPAAALPISDVGPALAAAADADAPSPWFRAAPKTGPNFWIDFVSTRNGQIVRLFSDDMPGHKVLAISRFANVLAVGFEWANDLLSVTVSDCVLDAGRVDPPGSQPFVESLGFFTSPAASLSVRPIPYLRFDVDAAYTWGMQVREKDGDGWSHQMVSGGIHVVYEPVRRYFGTTSQFEIAAGVRAAWGSATLRPNTGPDVEYDGTALLFGGRVASVTPLGEELALFVALGAYYGLDPSDPGHTGGGQEKHLDLEWSAGIRWFPYGG